MNGAGETAQLKISHIGKSSALFLLLTLWDFALGILTIASNLRVIIHIFSMLTKTQQR
jgi:hypothetical protein